MLNPTGRLDELVKKLAISLILPSISLCFVGHLLGTEPQQEFWGALYKGGIEFEEFLSSVNHNRDDWLAAYSTAPDRAEWVRRVEHLRGRWALLVVAEDWCLDSMHLVPYLARFVNATGNLTLRIIDRTAGEPVLRMHPTSDGRIATPTILILDETLVERASIVERPATLQAWYSEQSRILPADKLRTALLAYYQENMGRDVVNEVVVALEQAARDIGDE